LRRKVNYRCVGLLRPNQLILTSGSTDLLGLFISKTHFRHLGVLATTGWCYTAFLASRSFSRTSFALSAFRVSEKLQSFSERRFFLHTRTSATDASTNEEISTWKLSWFHWFAFNMFQTNRTTFSLPILYIFHWQKWPTLVWLLCF